MNIMSENFTYGTSIVVFIRLITFSGFNNRAVKHEGEREKI